MLPTKATPTRTVFPVKRIDKGTIEETDTLDGKVLRVTRMTLVPDGKSMAILSKDAQDGTTNQVMMHR